MRVDLPGLAIVAGLLLPVLAAVAWAVALERRPRRARAASAYTVAAIQARLRREAVADGPTAPIPAQTGRDTAPDRLPWRVPGVVPPPRPSSKTSPFAFAPPDTDLMRRVLDGLRDLP